MSDVLGIDIGGVIIRRFDAHSDTSFQTDFLNTPEVEGALETIRRLVDLRFGDRVHLVSKCGAHVEALTRQWLDVHAFPKSGVRPDHVHFCRTREAKAPICEALGVTHFIDDRLEVLGHLTSVEHRYLFQPVAAEMQAFARHLDAVQIVRGWDEVATALLGEA